MEFEREGQTANERQKTENEERRGEERGRAAGERRESLNRFCGRKEV